jgi:hypothetical protein
MRFFQGVSGFQSVAGKLQALEVGHSLRYPPAEGYSERPNAFSERRRRGSQSCKQECL